MLCQRPFYLPALASTAPDDFRCTVARQEGRIVGFVTSLRSGATAFGYSIGFDREFAATGVALFLRLLHSTITDAIEWGCAELSLGRTAVQPKAGPGAKLQPMSVWMRHRLPAINWVIREILGSVPHAEAPDINTLYVFQA